LWSSSAAQDSNTERLSVAPIAANSLSSSSVSVVNSGQSLSLRLEHDALAAKRVTIPRLCASINSMRWQRGDEALHFTPEVHEWAFSWDHMAAEGDVILVELEHPPLLLADLLPVGSSADGSIMLHAHQAATHGEKLRFEPQPFKNTVGYWTVPTDYASWSLSVDQPGTFSVAVLQGLGEGQGGSDAMITLLNGDSPVAELPFQPIETGHFQNFRWGHLGLIDITTSGKHELRITPVHIAKAALVDVRAVHLVRQAAGRK
jgi:hypothetical protein